MKRRLRRTAPVVGVAVLMLGSAIAAMAGRGGLAVSLLALLAGGIALLALSQRARTADLAHMMRLAAGRQNAAQETMRNGVAELRTSLAGLRDDTDGRLPELERRLLGALESERLRAADRHHEILERHRQTLDGHREILEIVGQTGEYLTKLDQRIRTTSKRTVNELSSLSWGQLADVEAMFQLLPRVNARAPLPSSGNWAMNARSLLHLLDVVEQTQPRTLLELGGGTSTIWLGYVLEGTGARILSLDHDEDFANATREAVTRHKLSSFVEVRTAPLAPLSIRTESFNWYDVSAFADIEEIDMLIVDGPPKATGPLARYPALPQALPRLAANATIILDDAQRPEEATIVERWLAEVPGLVQRDLNLTRLAVLGLKDVGD